MPEIRLNGVFIESEQPPVRSAHHEMQRDIVVHGDVCILYLQTLRFHSTCRIRLGKVMTVEFAQQENDAVFRHATQNIADGEQKTNIHDRISRMGNRCRVTFFDREHDMRRSIEVRGSSPIAAADAGLRWMLDHQIWTGEFSDSVEVEVVYTEKHTLPLAAIRQRMRHTGEVKSKVA